MKTIFRVVAFAIGIVAIGLLILYMLQENFIFYPEKLQDDFQFNFPWQFEERNFQTMPGVKINALHFRAAKPKGVVLYFHGNAGSLQSWGWVAEDFVPRGWDLLIIDYRTYGKSKGSLSETGLYKDAQFIYNELLKEYTESSILVYGRSLGTGIAARLARDNQPSRLILETPYLNFADLVKSINPMLPMWLLQYHFPTDKFIEEVKCPVMLIHGTNDEIIYFKSSEKLLKHIHTESRLVKIEGGHHNDLRNFPTYQQALDEVLE